MSNDAEYFHQCLWHFNDKQVSNSFLTFENFAIIDKWGLTPVRLKMSISQFKSQNSNYLFLTQSDVYQILMKLKDFNNIGKYIQEITQDNNKVINYTVKLKKKIIVSILYRTEYNGACVRVILSDKNDNYLDSEKIYLPIFDFLALIKLLISFRDEYLHVSSDVNHSVILGKIYEELHTLNEKVSGYYSEAVNLFKARSLLLEQQTKFNKTFSSSSELFSPDELPIKQSESLEISDNIDTFQNEKSKEEKTKIHDFDFFGLDEPEKSNDNLSEDNEIQSEMENFISNEAPKINLGLGDSGGVEKKKFEVNENIISSGDFTSKVLNNDVLNLEMYIMNVINDDLPFSKFCEIIKLKLGFDPLDGVKAEEISSINYLISNYLKHTLKKSLQEQVDFPANVSPIVFSNINGSPQIKSLMYDLLIYFIYYTQLRNMLKEKDLNPLKNKDFMCFSFKTIASPLAISALKNVDETTVLSEITNRYRRYRDNKVFDKLKDFVKNNYSCDFDLFEDAMKVEASRIHKAVLASFDKLMIPYSFKKYEFLNLKLNYDDFKNNSFDNEQIKKIISLEFNFKKNGKVNFDEVIHKKFDDISSSVLNKFNIQEKKYDNTNLNRLIKEFTNDNEELQKKALDVVKNINFSYRDLRNAKVDLTPLTTEILRAIFLWDIDRDSKITLNYLHYRETVQKCSLTKDMIISLLTNIQDTIDVDFVNSFIAVRN